jgi:hypothetical protein
MNSLKSLARRRIPAVGRTPAFRRLMILTMLGPGIVLATLAASAVTRWQTE